MGQPKLRFISFDRAPAKVPGFRPGDMGHVDLTNPPTVLYGWRMSIRGNTIYMISPPGWDESNATEPRRRNEEGPCVVVEIPRSQMYLRWEATGDEVLEAQKIQKWDGGLIGPPKPIVTDGESILAQIPKHEIGD